MEKKLSDSIENFGFTFSGNQVYFKEVVLPLIEVIDKTYKEQGLIEVPSTKEKKGIVLASDSLIDSYNQIIIILKDRPVEFEIVKIILEITIVKIVDIFQKKGTENTKIAKAKTRFTIRKKNKEATIEIPWNSFTDKDAYKRVSEFVNDILRQL